MKSYLLKRCSMLDFKFTECQGNDPNQFTYELLHELVTDKKGETVCNIYGSQICSFSDYKIGNAGFIDGTIPEYAYNKASYFRILDKQVTLIMTKTGMVFTEGEGCGPVIASAEIPFKRTNENGIIKYWITDIAIDRHGNLPEQIYKDANEIHLFFYNVVPLYGNVKLPSSLDKFVIYRNDIRYEPYKTICDTNNKLLKLPFGCELVLQDKKSYSYILNSIPNVEDLYCCVLGTNNDKY